MITGELTYLIGFFVIYFTFKIFFFCRPLLKQIKNSAVAHIVLDCNNEKVYEVLKQSQQIGMMSDYHSYLITSLVSTSKNSSFSLN